MELNELPKGAAPYTFGAPTANIRHYPVGTLEELKELCENDEDRFELARRMYATCSKPDADNRGCFFFKKCEFKKWRAVVGPRRVGVLSALLGGAAAVRAMACFVYMQVLHPIKMLSKSQAVRIVAMEGDVIKVRESVRIGNLKDPKDTRHRLVLVPRVIKPFPRPKESLAEIAFTMQALAESTKEREGARDTAVFGTSYVGAPVSQIETLGTLEAGDIGGAVPPEVPPQLQE